MTWDKLVGRERLTIKFDYDLPTASPKQRGLNQIFIPLPGAAWQKERKPKIPKIPASSLIGSISLTGDGILIQTRTDAFDFVSGVARAEKKMTLEIGPYEKGRSWRDTVKEPETPQSKNATTPQTNATASPTKTPDVHANASLSINATVKAHATASLNASSPATAPKTEGMGMPSDSSRNDTTPLGAGIPALRPEIQPEALGASSLRGKIERPGPDANQTGTSSRLRMPISRDAEGSAAMQGASNGSGLVSESGVAHNGTNASTLPVPAPHVASIPAQNETGSRSHPGNETALQTVPITPTDTHSPVNQSAGKSEPENAGTPRDTKTPKRPKSGEGSTPAKTRAPIPEANTTLPGKIESAPQNENTGTPRPEPTDIAVTTDNATTANATSSNATADNSTAELEALYKTAQTALSLKDFKGGRNAINAMLQHPKAHEGLRSDLLYTVADIAMMEGTGDMEGNFTTIREAYETAQNMNPASPNLPHALSSLGFLHLSVGNVPEAKGYFDLLRRKYPDNPRVAMIDYYWGEYYLKKKDFARAAQHFQYVIQNYPMGEAVQMSTVGLLKAFSELGYFDKAMEIVDSIEKRWPRYYVSRNGQSFLMAAGYAAMMSGKLDRAREYFWAYVNIVPQADDADVAMARIGDILVKQGRLEEGRDIYRRTAKTYPDREGGLIAQMRIAEEGILDQPTMANMDPIFNRAKADPEEIYTHIIGHADSPLAPVARLKRAMWRLWKKRFAESLEDVQQFQADYPGHELLPKAREIADKALEDWIVHDLGREKYADAVEHWGKYQSLFHDRELNQEVRLALATSYMKTGQLEQALDMARPFVFGPTPRGPASEPGMDLTLAMLVDLQQWRDILELARLVGPWKLGQDRQRQVDYAAALAHEKLNQHTAARPLWIKLATDMKLTDTQRGYAHYFLGRGAMEAGDFEQATILTQEGLNLLQKDAQDIPKLKETLELLIQAAERSGRIQDALGWCLQYDGYVQQNDPDWPKHTYRKGILFRKNGEMKKWRDSLQQLKELFPNTLHGRMAAAELEGVRLEREVEKFR